MIHYELCCKDGHGFDGWFKDSASFDKQESAGLLECPICGTAEVTRALMTPAVTKRGRRVPQLSAPAPEAKIGEVLPPESPVAVDEARIPAQVRAALQRLRSEVESNCDYVGSQFADEARKMHRGESERRGIYGETTPEQAETLAEEGIQVARIPWVPRADG
jgi:hypothetical protein